MTGKTFLSLGKNNQQLGNKSVSIENSFIFKVGLELYFTENLFAINKPLGIIDAF